MDKKKRTRGAHKASATRLIGQIEEVVASAEPSIPRLKTLRTSLEQKLEVIKKLDEEIVDLMEDETEMTSEVEQADVYKETVYSALLQAEGCLKTVKFVYLFGHDAAWRCFHFQTQRSEAPEAPTPTF